MISSEAVLGLPGYQITGIEEEAGMVRVSARHVGEKSCPHCQSQRLRLKDRRWRQPRHESWGLRHCVLELESCKYRRQDCRRTFWQRFPGLLVRKRATEPFRRSVFVAHLRWSQSQPFRAAREDRRRHRGAFPTKMEVLQRQAYGFRNFQNYRLRVRVTCT